MKYVEGIIKPGSRIGKSLGFTREKFDGWLWIMDNAIYLSMIFSLDPGKGNLSKLMNNILKEGFIVKVPTPLGRMLDIVQAKGFYPVPEGEYMVWIKQPKRKKCQ